MAEEHSSRSTVYLLMSLYFPMLILICLFAIAFGIVFAILATQYPRVIGMFLMLPGIYLFAMVGQVGYAARVLIHPPSTEDPHEFQVPREWLSTLERETRRVAKAHRTPVPDEIRLHPFDVSYVYEADDGARILVVGGLGLAALSEEAFLGVIAHELGHFAEGDTTLTRRSKRWHLMMAMVEQEFSQHPATPFNPLAWLIRGYHYGFDLAWTAHLRAQEFLADSYEADQVGERQTARTLILLHALEHLPWAKLSSIAELQVATGGSGERIFSEQTKRIRQTTPKQWQVAVQKALKEKPKKFDSHPSLKERVKVLGLHKKDVLEIAETLNQNPGTARDLVDGWEGVEKLFSEHVIDLVERYRANKYEVAQIFMGRPIGGY